MVEKPREKLKKIRVDQWLVQKGFFSSREKAKAAVMAGEVFLNDTLINKPSELVCENSDIRIKERRRFVSRGGEKLDPVISSFKIDVTGLDILDIGASTGGFTDCLLKRGADKVIALDVGKGQLDWNLRNDKRVTVLEGVNARYLTLDQTGYVDMVVIDVSFISLEKILPVVKNVLKPEGKVVALIKPQFEAGVKNISRGGVVRDEAVRLSVIDKISNFAIALGFTVNDIEKSPLKGPAGNVEYFIYLKN